MSIFGKDKDKSGTERETTDMVNDVEEDNLDAAKGRPDSMIFQPPAGVMEDHI